MKNGCEFRISSKHISTTLLDFASSSVIQIDFSQCDIAFVGNLPQSWKNFVNQHISFALHILKGG